MENVPFDVVLKTLSSVIERGGDCSGVFYSTFG